VTVPIKPKARGDLAMVELDGEAVIYDEGRESLHHLNPTATIVFSLFDGASTVREISEEIAAAFEVAPDDVERHVRALWREFRMAGLMDGTLAENQPVQS